MKTIALYAYCILFGLIISSGLQGADSLVPNQNIPDYSSHFIQLPNAYPPEIQINDKYLKEYKIRIIAPDESIDYKISTIIPDSIKKYTMQIFKPDEYKAGLLHKEHPLREFQLNLPPDTTFWNYKDYLPQPKKNETEK